jgi:hypothetical protein
MSAFAFASNALNRRNMPTHETTPKRKSNRRATCSKLKPKRKVRAPTAGGVAPPGYSESNTFTFEQDFVDPIAFLSAPMQVALLFQPYTMFDTLGKCCPDMLPGM